MALILLLQVVLIFTQSGKKRLINPSKAILCPSFCFRFRLSLVLFPEYGLFLGFRESISYSSLIKVHQPIKQAMQILKLQRCLRHNYRADDIRQKSRSEAADKYRPDDSDNCGVDVKELSKPAAHSADHLIIAGFIKLFIHIISLLSKYVQGNARSWTFPCYY